MSKNPTAGGRQSDDADGGRDDTGDLRLRLVRGMLWTALGLIMLVRLLSAWQEELPWSGLALVLDVDGHALTWSAVDVGAEQVRLVQTQAVPQLARGA